MFVNTNVAALNAWRNLENTQQNMTGVLQQLSSGYSINSAADNPAGLAISQQMQSQINGMNQAYQNAQSGITLLQTADGAMGQVQNILQSMYSLASQAATGTNNATDLQALQSEMNQYAQEITQIANTTQFNNLNLLGGVFQSQSIQIGANAGQSLTISIASVDAYSLGVSGEGVTSVTPGALSLVQNGATPAVTGMSTTAGGAYDMLSFISTPWTPTVATAAAAFTLKSVSGDYASATSETIQLSVPTSAGTQVTYTITYASGTTSVDTVAYNGTSGTFNVTDAAGNSLTFTVNTANAAAVTATIDIAPQATNFYVAASGTALTQIASNSYVSSGTLYGAISSGEQVNLTNSSNDQAFAFIAGGGVPSTSGYSFTFTGTTGSLSATMPTTSYTVTTTGADQIAAAATTDVYTFGVTQSGGAAGSGSPSNFNNATVSNGLDITSQATAAAALTILQTAINNVSSDRASVGAYQNRLQFASSQLQTTSQNLTTAQAGIMDTNVAEQMANLTKYQILQQAGVSMLAQANAMPQALLKLFP